MTEKKRKPANRGNVSIEVRDLDPGQGPKGGSVKQQPPAGVKWEGPDYDAFTVKKP